MAAALLVATGLPVAAGAIGAPATAAPPGSTPPVAQGLDPSSRASVLQAYQQQWVPAARTTTGWTGSTSPCVPGTDTAKAQAATLTAVNFARGLVGRKAVTMDATLSAAAMKAALISQANNSLNHQPPSTAACWTQAGADASGASNLYGVSTTPAYAATPIESYLDDPGASNTFAAHRRWILFSRLTKVGSGTTTGANALYVIDPTSWLKTVSTKVSAWPSAGYFPASLEPGGRWSLSVPNADFSAATVTVKQGTTVLPTTVTSRTVTGYGDNTLVWSVDPRYDISRGDIAYTVAVTGYTVGGVSKTTKYTTTLFDATVGLTDRHVISFPFPKAKRTGVTFDPGATDSRGLTVYYYSDTPGVCTASQNPNRVTTVAPGTCSIGAFVPHDNRYPDAPTETRTFTVVG